MIFTRMALKSVGTVPGGVFVLVFGGIPAVIGFENLVRFSIGNEAKIVSDFEETKTLPKSIRRRLKREHFKQVGFLLRKAPPAQR